MDTENRPNRTDLSPEDYSLLKTRIVETCKYSNGDFTDSTKQLTDNINFVFKESYTTEQVNYVLGCLYEVAFYHGQPETFEEKLK